MDDAITALLLDVPLGELARSIWEPALARLGEADADEAPFLDSVEDVARGAGLVQSVPVATLLEAFSEGGGKLCAALRSSGHAGAGAVRRRIEALEPQALTRIAAGYSAGLEDTIARLRSRAAEASPKDAVTGAMKPDEIMDRLALEVNRCQRMDLSLGLLELGLDWAGEEPREALHQVGECVRENLRRYDSIGLTRGGGFLLVLPDISRRGLAGAAERLRREIADCAGPGPRPDFVFALAHYDFVDASASEMLTTLEMSVRRARAGHQPVTWS